MSARMSVPILFSLLLSLSGSRAPANEPVPKPSTVIDVGGEKQLFIDDLFLEKSEGVSVVMHPALKTGERTLEADKPWEDASLNWFSVLEDGGKFRMWYECYDVEGWPTSDDTSFCYAESSDGIHWVKPSLGLFEYHGSKDNNILFRQIGPDGARSRVHGTNVFIDPNAPPESRYKCVSQGIFQGRGDLPYRIAGMTSPDGLRWTRLPEPICDVFADSQYSGFWDAQRSLYVLFGRVSGKGRSIGSSRSTDFAHFEPLALVLENEPNCDLYNPAALKYPHAENAYFMFPSFYNHQEDTLDIHLAVSRDGIHWTWPDRATPFISLGKSGDFDTGSLYMGQGLLRVGNEIWQYYSGAPLKHEEATLEKLTIPANRRFFSRVTSRLDGFVSVDAGAQSGTFTTPPIRFKGNRLVFNAAIRAGGELRAGLLDEKGTPIPGFAIEDSAPITGDHTEVAAEWTSKPALAAWAGRTVRLTFRMSNASLFAFQFKESK